MRYLEWGQKKSLQLVVSNQWVKEGKVEFEVETSWLYESICVEV